jgi:hypothetical protein
VNRVELGQAASAYGGWPPVIGVVRAETGKSAHVSLKFISLKSDSATTWRRDNWRQASGAHFN